MAEDKSWTQRLLRFSFLHVAAIGAGLWVFPGAIESLHALSVAKISAMKASLATYAATTPGIPVGGFEALSKSAAGMLANFSFGGHAAAGAGAFIPPAPAMG